MNDNNFRTLYKTWATDKLLDIIDNEHEYQSEAVVAARLELNSRQLSAEQLDAARTIQAERHKQEKNAESKKKVVGDRIKSIGLSIVDTLNPLPNEGSVDRIIKQISLLLGGLLLYELYVDFGILKFIFTDSSAKWDHFGSFFNYMPLVLLPAAGLLMWLRKQLGWMLTAFYFSYTADGAALLFLSALKSRPTGNEALDTLFPPASPMVSAGTFILLGSATWVLTRHNIRTVYRVDERTMIVSISIGAAAFLLMALAT